MREKRRDLEKEMQREQKKRGRQGGGKKGRKERGRKKEQEEEWKVKLCYSVSLITRKVKSIYCDQ